MYNYIYKFNMFKSIESSIWPFLSSCILFSLFVNFVLYMNKFINLFNYLISIILLIMIMILWWKDVMRESIMGYHNSKLELSFRIGMMLFILSEVFFFLSFFWAFFDSSLSPCIELGLQWPPKGVQIFSIYSVPLLNTIILLSSGLSITWAHHSLMNNFFTKTLIALLFTIILGIYFLFMQYIEYNEASFSISDSIYGSTFFMTTGFHGFHVLVGMTFISVVTVFLIRGLLMFNHHFSFEAAAWYWHFVDVVWLFLFIIIYWWPSL